MRLFLDTSALAKLFVEEMGTPEVTARVIAAGTDVWVSQLASLGILHLNAPWKAVVAVKAVTCCWC